MKTLEGNRVLITGAGSGIGMVMANFPKPPVLKSGSVMPAMKFCSNALKKIPVGREPYAMSQMRIQSTSFFRKLKKVSEDWKFL